MKASLTLLLIFLTIPTHSYAASLFSSDFEDQNISSWNSSGGGASASVSSELSKNGNFALKVQNDKTSSYGYQILIPDIEGGMFYQAQAFGKSNNAFTNNFFIRIAWYSTNDGSGSQISTPSDSNQGTINDNWAELKTSAIQAPSLANSAKFRLVLTSKSAGNIASAFFDDVNFEEAVAPTPTPTDTPTKEPTPTKTPTPAPFKTPTPTPSTKPTVTKTTAKSATKSANLSGIPTSVLGANTKTTNKKAQDDKSAKVLGAAADSRNNFRLIILALGIILLACAILVFLRSRTKNLE